MKILIFFSFLIFATAADAQSAAPIRILSGTAKVYTDSHGNVWEPDTDFNVGSSGPVTLGVKGTSDPTLYQSERYSLNDTPALTYKIPATAGTYTLNLYFAETYFSSKGQRVFSVKVNGATVLTNFDIVAVAGATLTATIQTFLISSTGTVTIEFDHGSANNPKIDAIELIPIVQNLPNVLLLINSLAPNASSILFDDQSVVYVGPITVQQKGPAGNLVAGAISVDTKGLLSGSISVNPNAGYLDPNGNMTFLFNIPNMPGAISQTLSAAEFQQGALGITVNMVIYRAPLFAPKPGVLPQLALKSFGVSLTP
jgi:malectin (di-glucose binding ER protein)